MEIKIKCLSCGKILRIPDGPNVNNAVFTCPVCKEKHKVGECQRVVDVPKPRITSEETQYGGFYPPSSNDGDETQIAGATPKSLSIGKLVDGLGRMYQLSNGINTIGRKAASSSAAVQIDVDDRYMSRNHGIIEVRMAGGQLMHILRNGEGKNPSYHNGVLIAPSDQLILNDGDRIKMGNTELIFRK